MRPILLSSGITETTTRGHGKLQTKTWRSLNFLLTLRVDLSFLTATSHRPRITFECDWKTVALWGVAISSEVAAVVVAVCYESLKAFIGKSASKVYLYEPFVENSFPVLCLVSPLVLPVAFGIISFLV